MMLRSRSMNGLMKGLFTASVMVVSLGLFVGSASAQTGAIEGTVSDAVSGLPIEGAIVMARGSFDGGEGPGHGGHMALTDELGGYVFDDLEAGEYSMICGALGYVRQNVSVVVAEDQTTAQNFLLEPLAFGSVDGLVTDAASGLPIGGARVVLRPVSDADPENTGHWLTAVTGSDGMYMIENVLAGDYEARASAFGYLPSDPVPLSVSEGATTTVDLELAELAFGSVEGTVTDAATGAFVDGAYVSLSRAWGGSDEGTDWHWFHAVTDENGYYSFDDVEVATYRVAVSAHGYAKAQVEVEVLDGQLSVVDVALEPLVFGMVEGTVTSAETGEPLDRALVVILPTWMEGMGGHGGWWVQRTDESGAYQFEEVPTGDYRMVTFARGFSPGRVEIEVIDGQTTTVDFALEPHCVRTIQVR